MKVIILIHAHKNTSQLNVLINQLEHNNLTIYVNIDLKSNINVDKIDKKAKLIKKRIPVYWGDYSQVEAVLNSLEEIIQGEECFDYVILISGQDFPLISNDDIIQRLEENQGREYLYYKRIGKNGWRREDRYEYYHYKGKYILLRVCYKILRVIMKILNIKRRMIFGYEPFGGSAWWILSKQCISYVIDYKNENQEYLRFMKKVRIPDEMFFQTIIMNSKFKDKVINDNMRYIDWSNCRKGLSSNPNNLSEKDYTRIIHSNAMFCRKIDLPYSESLVQFLILNRKKR